MLKVFAINGSPRKNFNTATVLQKALDGAKEVAQNHSMEIQAEMINLYDLHYTGCKSCFGCKLLGGKSYGKCAIKDDLAPVFEKLADADVIIFGSPIYFSFITGEMRSFLERLCFQYYVYDINADSLAPKKSMTGFIYTMNCPAKMMEDIHYPDLFKVNEQSIEKIFTKPEVLYVNDTYQFTDYSKYKMEYFKEEDKAKVRKEQFPIDCENSFKLGSELTERAIKQFHSN